MEYTQDVENNNVSHEGNLDPAELAVLEEKIDRLVDYCTRLREENSRLSSELADRNAEVASLKARLGEYDAMRNDVRDRISRLVRTIEELEAAPDTSSEAQDGEVSHSHGSGSDGGEDGNVSQPELLPSDSSEV